MPMSEPIYGRAAHEYWNLGWRGVIPIPPRRKIPPPDGYTGNAGIMPSYPDIQAWCEDKPDWNLALRLPRGMVGIDVDDYDEKNGAATLAEAESRWGPLPNTWISTARTEGVSGIRLFAIPENVRLRDRINFGPELGDIEICQFHHRFVMAWPSIHKTGNEYSWRREGTAAGLDLLPGWSTIPELPVRWMDALRVPEPLVSVQADVQAVLANLPQGYMSVSVERSLHKALQQLHDGTGSRHDNTRDNVLRLLRLAEEGEPGVGLAIDALRINYCTNVSDRASIEEAALEFDRMVTGQNGHNLIASTPSTANLLGLDRPNRLEFENSQRTTDTGYKFDNSDDSAVCDEPTTAPATDPPAGDHADAQPDRSRDVDAVLGRGPVQPIESTPAPEDEDLLPLLTISDLAALTPAAPLIEGLLYAGTLAQVAGQPGTYKTFLALSWACAVSSPIDRWEGYPVKAHGPVLYIAAEGANGMRPRILAWCEANDVDPSDLPLLVYPEPVQLGSRLAMARLTVTAQQIRAKLIVFDTRARCTLDLEENSATEQSEAIEAAERLRVATGATVLMVHHSSRSGTAGRGSSAWDGALWSDLRVTAERFEDTMAAPVLHLEVEKHKDAPAGMTLDFELVHHTVSPKLMPLAPDQDQFSRNTLLVAHYVPDGRDGNEETILGILRNSGRLTRSELRDMAMEHGLTRATAYRTIKQLAESGRIVEHGTEQRPSYEIRVLGK
ncbi:AAA family ATPase [Nocardia sp. NPDC058058]|uniref:AAA family ATPase n=1 Tax=Nocardia sp. NPDC058058 TaxID=3346317 RepID=UPI0036DECC35